jgi:signal transduction histidine kinase
MNEASFYKAFNALLVECTSLIVQSDEKNFHDRMNLVLEKIGRFSKVDRAYYFTINHEDHTSSNLNEWCKPGVEPQIENLQGIPNEIVPNWIENMQQGKEIYIDDLNKLDEKWAPEKEILEPQGIQSLLSIPVRESETLYGFVGFDAVEFKVEWTDDSRHLLRILADNIGSVIRRNIQNDELQRRTRELELAKENLSILNRDLERKVIENTQKYLELNHAYNEQEKFAAIGEVAAGVAHDLNTPISNVMIGAENLQNSLQKLLGEQILHLTGAQIAFAVQLASRYKPDIFLSGLQMEKERNQVFEILTESIEIDESDLKTISETLVQCRILDEKTIKEVAGMSNVIELLQTVQNLQTSFNLITTIVESSRRSASVVQDLREHINKTDKIVKKVVVLEQSIKSALNVFNYLIGEKIEVEMQIDKSVSVFGFEIKLFQLWSNLIKNAIEALKDTRSPVIKIYSKTEGDRVDIYFENNGPVIPEELSKHILNRFFTTKSLQSSSGLGLTIVQNVIHEHDGNMHIESDQNRTVFIVSLPLLAQNSQM